LNGLNYGENGGGGESPPPELFTSWNGDGATAEEHAIHSCNHTSENVEETFPGATLCRGGDANEIANGAMASLSRVASFWKSTWDGAFSSVTGLFRSKEVKKQQELLEQLQTMPVQRVAVPNSTVLPDSVVRTAVKRSGLLGSPLRTDRVQEFAKHLKRWYVRQGYVLHSVTGATLKPETATAVITVEEPTVSRRPVDIVFLKEMVVDEDTGEPITFRQYREKKTKELQESRATGSKFQRLDRQLDRQNLNTTFVMSKGRTKPSKVAGALKLIPGQPFQWQQSRWEKVSTSGIFSKILRASPERTSDGGVCLQVYVTEPPPRHLEYGIGKSIWTNSWEGEVDFDWRNIFGGGESMGVLVRRGTKDSSPSVRVRYGDDKFGLEGGYDVEVFTDFLGDSPKDTKKEQTDTSLASEPIKALEIDEDTLLHRRGATFRLRNPISPSIIRNSVASASVERTSTTTGLHESIGSATLTLGPFRRYLPMDARSSVSTTITGGTRLKEVVSMNGEANEAPAATSMFSASNLLPYTSASATTSQILPIFVASRNGDGQPITLAFKHTFTTSSANLPRHEAKAMGNSAQIRGASPDGPTSSAIRGTTEVRVPVGVPLFGNGSLVFFGDWFYVQKDANSPFYSKSSIGVGIRKSIQGLPLKYEVCYSREGGLKTLFGLSPDFDA
jgi:outer membrane protein assembly factor BamA